MKIIKKIACLFLFIGIFYQYTQASHLSLDELSDDELNSLLSSGAFKSDAPASPAQYFNAQDELLEQAVIFWHQNHDQINRIGELKRTSLTQQDAQLFEQAFYIGENLLMENLLSQFYMQYKVILPAALSSITTIKDEANNQRLRHLKSQSQLLLDEASHPASLSDLQLKSHNPFSMSHIPAHNLDYLNSENRLDQAKEIASHVSKPSFDETAPNSMTIGTIETIYQYITGYAHNRNLETITNNLQPCSFIINSRGDGNCGYRAFYASLLMNATQSGNQNIIPFLERFLQEKYIPLFMQYNLNFRNNKNLMGQRILHYLLEQLNNFKECQNIHEVRNLLNREYAFDYYMIMFLRYLLLDYIHQNDGDAFTMVIKASRNDNLNEISTWGFEIENVEMYLFAKILPISIYTLAQNSIDNVYILNRSALEEIGIATILYVTGHYRIFIPASYAKNILDQRFKEVGKSNKVQKVYADAQEQAQAFWTDPENLDEFAGLKESNRKYQSTQKDDDRPAMLSSHKAHLVEEAIAIGNRLLQEGSLHNFAQQYNDLSDNLHYAIRIHEEIDPAKIFTLKEQLAHLAELAHNASH